MRIKCEDKSVVFKYVFLVPFGLCLNVLGVRET
jgi:hypothetical protein